MDIVCWLMLSLEKPTSGRAVFLYNIPGRNNDSQKSSPYSQYRSCSLKFFRVQFTFEIQVNSGKFIVGSIALTILGCQGRYHVCNESRTLGFWSYKSVMTYKWLLNKDISVIFFIFIYTCITIFNHGSMRRFKAKTGTAMYINSASILWTFTGWQWVHCAFI